jgi:hypothetical protein
MLMWETGKLSVRKLLMSVRGDQCVIYMIPRSNPNKEAKATGKVQICITPLATFPAPAKAIADNAEYIAATSIALCLHGGGNNVWSSWERGGPTTGQ